MLYLYPQTLQAYSFDVDVWGYTDSYAAGVQTDLVAAWADVVAWLGGIGRPWYGMTGWTATWVRDSATSGAAMQLVGAMVFELYNVTSNGLGIEATGGAVSTVQCAAAQGSWWPQSDVSVVNHSQQLGDGEACGDGAVRPGAPGTSAYKPQVTAVGDAVDAGRLASLEAQAQSPRGVRVYQHHTQLWRTYALGTVERTKATSTLFQFRLQCLGAA